MPQGPCVKTNSPASAAAFPAFTPTSLLQTKPTLLFWCKAKCYNDARPDAGTICLKKLLNHVIQVHTFITKFVSPWYQLLLKYMTCRWAALISQSRFCSPLLLLAKLLTKLGRWVVHSQLALLIIHHCSLDIPNVPAAEQRGPRAAQLMIRPHQCLPLLPQLRLQQEVTWIC